MTEIERSIGDLKNGKDSALHFLYNQFKRLLFKNARNCGLTIEDSEERVQDTFIKLIDEIDKFTYKDDASFVRWLTTVHKNGILQFLRDRKKNQTSPLEEWHEYQENELLGDESQKDPRMKIISDEFQQLDEIDRVLLTMRAKGISYRKISECLDGKNPNSLKVRRKRVYDRLIGNLTVKFKEMGAS